MKYHCLLIITGLLAATSIANAASLKVINNCTFTGRLAISLQSWGCWDFRSPVYIDHNTSHIFTGLENDCTYLISGIIPIGEIKTGKHRTTVTIDNSSAGCSCDQGCE